MLKRICVLLTLIMGLSLTGVAYAAPPVQEQSQKSLVEVVREAGNFTTLIQALDAANLSGTLENEGPFTVFAPTDEAFAALPPGALEELFADPQALRDLLSYHVIEGELATTDLATTEALATLQGAALTINTVNGGIMVGGATVTGEPVQAANGIIYTIDTVLMPPNAMMSAEPEMTEPSSGQPAGPTVAAQAGACAEDYVVQADDSLSQIANKFYGNPQQFSTIVAATNAQAASNPTYALIDDPNLIVVGQTLCIPASTDAEMAPSDAEMAPTTGNGAAPTVPNDEAMTPDNQMITVPEGKGVLVFENLSSYDIVFDLSGPTPDSLVVPPGAKQNFVLEPGQYNYNGHQPGAGYSVAPGEFELAARQAVMVSCYNNEQCLVQSLNSPRMEAQ